MQSKMKLLELGRGVSIEVFIVASELGGRGFNSIQQLLFLAEMPLVLIDHVLA